MIPITGSFRFVRVAGATFINVLNLLYRQYHATAVGVRHDRYLVKGGNDQAITSTRISPLRLFCALRRSLARRMHSRACLL